MKQAMCHHEYDPYFGFKVIKKGRIVWVRDNGNGIFTLLDNDSVVLGTIHLNSFFQYFN